MQIAFSFSDELLSEANDALSGFRLRPPGGANLKPKPTWAIVAENLALAYGYTAKDLAAVRAYVQRVAPAVVARTYYDGNEDSFAATPWAMERHLRAILGGLVKVAIELGSPALAEHLRASVNKHGEPKLTAVTFRIVTEAAALATAAAGAMHSIGRRFRPLIATRLKGEGITTIGELVAFCKSARRQLVALDSTCRRWARSHHRWLAAPK